MSASFVLVHSPLVGPVTWDAVGEELRVRGHVAVGAVLGRGVPPLWEHHAEEAAVALRAVPGDPLLVGHSGAGVLLPEIRRRANRAVAAYVFVDAQIPVDGASRVELWRQHEPGLVRDMERLLAGGEDAPFWDEAELQVEVPDPVLRARLQGEVQPRGMEFYAEAVRVFDGWPDAPCAYLRFSDAYEPYERAAAALGWPTRILPGGHFHMLVDPGAVTDLLESVAAGALSPHPPA